MPLNNQNSKSAGCKKNCRVKEKHGFFPNSKKKEPVGTCRYTCTFLFELTFLAAPPQARGSSNYRRAKAAPGDGRQPLHLLAGADSTRRARVRLALRCFVPFFFLSWFPERGDGFGTSLVGG